LVDVFRENLFILGRILKFKSFLFTGINNFMVNLFNIYFDTYISVQISVILAVE